MVSATDAAGRSWPMAYALMLTARDGRWEIASLDTDTDTDTGTGTAAAPRS
ncbi:hypothetical protein [Streptomyces tanashiensis]|uniref:hypothetical protein n=1 Tax=Streptomyces tanashiensis TaxID=67367 RepID=UPI001672D273|nr:hypothetical protein [Streptomyces tanashiensis]